MKRLFGSIRFKIIVLAILAGLTFQFAFSAKKTQGCERCVYPTGGICVACDTVTFGYNQCYPIQSTCSCEVRTACGPFAGFEE